MENAKKENGEKRMESVQEFSPMNGGNGTYSYSKNSNNQLIAANSVKEAIEQEISKKLDTKHLSLLSNTLSIVDLGCSTGPNTFIAMQNIVETIQLKHNSQCPNNSKPLQFQVFFSDRPSNDFNTLFSSIPRDLPYFAAGVPGSFHARLFPESSLHVVHTCHALHWLSKLPQELLDKNSPAYNKGKIFYTNAPREVYDAYASQFYEDIGCFLTFRAKEIVSGGMMVIIMAGSPSGQSSYHHLSAFALTYDLLGSTLVEMSKEGLISEDLVESFNIPIYGASPEEMVGLVDKNGDFKIERIEFVKAVGGETAKASVVAKHTRAGLEGMLTKHFGSDDDEIIMDQLFQRFDKKVEDHSHLLQSTTSQSGQLFIVLKRK